MKLVLFFVGIVIGALAVTNPNEADFRDHVREKEGLSGTIGMAVTDLISGGVHRDNYWIASKFYLGGDGVIPRQELGWGMAGQIFKSSDL